MEDAPPCSHPSHRGYDTRSHPAGSFEESQAATDTHSFYAFFRGPYFCRRPNPLRPRFLTRPSWLRLPHPFRRVLSREATAHRYPYQGRFSPVGPLIRRRPATCRPTISHPAVPMPTPIEGAPGISRDRVLLDTHEIAVPPSHPATSATTPTPSPPGLSEWAPSGIGRVSER